jgi:hypothetical protein
MDRFIIEDDAVEVEKDRVLHRPTKKSCGARARYPTLRPSASPPAAAAYPIGRQKFRPCFCLTAFDTAW